jgi:hypothetical protein
MSFTQVLEELPVLTRQERRELSLRLLELDSSQAEADDIAICEHSAAMGFAMLDALEAEDAEDKSNLSPPSGCCASSVP